MGREKKRTFLISMTNPSDRCQDTKAVWNSPIWNAAEEDENRKRIKKQRAYVGLRNPARWRT